MKCPRCGSDVRPSQKYPGYYLCDTCRKRYPSSAVIDDADDGDDEPADEDFPLYSESRAQKPARSQRAPRGGASDRRSGQRTKASGHSPAKGRASDSRDRSSVRERQSSAPQRLQPQDAAEPKKRGGIGKVLLILLLLLLLAGAAFVGLVYFDIIENPLAGIGPFAGQEDAQDPEEGDTVPDPLATTYRVGDTAEYNGVSIQVISYEESTGDDWAAPAEGNVFVFVNIAITNQNEEELPVEKMASFENYCGGERLDYSANAFTALATNTDRQPMDGSIAGGETLNGYLCLEVPADWTTLTVQYANNVWSNDKVSFEITKQ